MKKLTSKLGLLALAGAIAFGSTSCKKEFINTDTTSTTSANTNTNTSTNQNWQGNAVYNRTVDYSVIVTAQTAGAFRSPQGVSGATVTLAVGGEIMAETTDANGVAKFSGLTYGIASATVSASGHASAHFTANLEDSNEDIDNHTNRTASSIVTLVPVTGLGTATVMGKLEVENIEDNSTGNTPIDDINPLVSTMGATLTATVDFNSAGNGVGNSGSSWVVHAGLGTASNFYMEGIRASETTALVSTVGTVNSDDKEYTYSYTIPATAYGLDVDLWANDFTGPFTTINDAIPGPGTTSTTTYANTYTANSGTNTWSNTAHPGEVFVWNIMYAL